MPRFALEFKQKVAEQYLQGKLSLVSVAELHAISPSTVRKWAYIYREHGIRTLTGKKGRYTADFKLIVISEILHNKL